MKERMAEKKTSEEEKTKKGSRQALYCHSSDSDLEYVPPTQEDMVEESNEDIAKKEGRSKPAIDFKSKPTTPNVAVQEKIIFCVDNSVDEAEGYTFVGDEGPSTYTLRNDAIKMFVINKFAIARDTEFALMSVEPGKSHLILPLTSDIDKFINCITEFKQPSKVTSGDFNITPIFSSVWQCTELPADNNTRDCPPSYVIRLILVYGNSFLEPSVDTTDPNYVKFMMSSSCVLDIFYQHEKPSDLNQVESVFRTFGEIISPESYLIENSRKVTLQYNNMAKLLAHPFQRVSQEMWAVNPIGVSVR